MGVGTGKLLSGAEGLTEWADGVEVWGLEDSS